MTAWTHVFFLIRFNSGIVSTCTDVEQHFVQQLSEADMYESVAITKMKTNVDYGSTYSLRDRLGK